MTLKMVHLGIYCVLTLLSFRTLVSATNFVIVLTDDQDVVLNGLNPMENVKKLLANNGAVFTNVVS